MNSVFPRCEEGDCLLLQNEISSMPEIMAAASSKSMQIVFNAAPITKAVLDYPLEFVKLFVLNEIEGEALSGEQEPLRITTHLIERYDNASVVLTLGEQGAIYADQERIVQQSAFAVEALDTTGAGDTFTGFFLANWLNGQTADRCLEIACKAAAVSVMRNGAATSIPRQPDIEEIFPD